MADLIRVPFYTSGGSEVIFGTKSNYKRYVVGVSVSCNKGTSKYQESFNLFTFISSIVSIFGEYNDYGATLKNMGDSFNLPITDTPYFEVAANETLFASGASSLATFAGIVVYYEEFIGGETVPLRMLMGVGT